MLDSYRSGGDPAACATALSTYLGHRDPGASYWYLSAAPELLELAAADSTAPHGGTLISALAPTLQAFSPTG